MLNSTHTKNLILWLMKNPWRKLSWMLPLTDWCVTSYDQVEVILNHILISVTISKVSNLHQVGKLQNMFPHCDLAINKLLVLWYSHWNICSCSQRKFANVTKIISENHVPLGRFVQLSFRRPHLLPLLHAQSVEVSNVSI